MEQEQKNGEYVTALMSYNVHRVIELFQKNIDSGMKAPDVVINELVPAMAVVGDKFQNGEIYIPEMILAAKTMAETIDRFKDQLTGVQQQKIGTVIIGTVKGDLHNIGKNLVIMMLEGQGFSVEDLGISVGEDKFVDAVKQKKPDILALSALLTTTISEMKTVIDSLKEAGLRDFVKVVVGGAPVTQKYADQIGADGYSGDAPGAVKICKSFIVR